MTKGFLATIFLCYVVFARVIDGAPPVLDLDGQVVFDVREKDDNQKPKPLVINCQGDSKLSWTAEVQDTFYSVQSNYTNGVYYSTLKLSEPYPEDTGYFNCSNDRSEIASSYVFIYDGVHGFVSFETPQTVDVSIGNPIFLNCRATHPDIHVTVRKDKIGDVTSRFTWDPYSGFWKTAESLQETGLYTCKEDRFSSNITRVITIYPNRMLQSPSIATFRNSHYVVGHDFSLECRIPVEMGNEPMFTWHTPQKNRMKESKGKNTGTNLASNKLTVVNPTSADTGTYTCSVMQGKESANDSIFITVQEKIEPYVKFNISETNQFGLFVKEGKEFKWVLYFRGFPNNLLYEFYDPLGNNLEDRPDEVAISYNYEEGMLQLLMNNIGAENFGNYSAMLKTPNGIFDTTSVVLLVNATPKVEFNAVPPLFHLNTQVSLSASILAFDLSLRLPNVTWQFYSHCPDGAGSCDKTQGLLLSHDLIKAKVPINRFRSTVAFHPESSGVIECKVKNNFGENSTMTNVNVADKNDSLSVTVVTESGTTYLRAENSSTVPIIEGDNITLECYMLNFLYRDLEFIQNGVDARKYNCDTKLSSGRCLSIDSVNKDAAITYSCGAVNRISQQEDKIIFYLKFIEKMAPIIRPESNVSEEGTLLSVDASEAFKIFCFVDGQPTPKITWYKDGENIEEIPNYVDEKKVFLHKDKQVLEFKFAQKEHEGKYMCDVENRVGTIRPFTTVTVAGTGLTPLYWGLIAFAIASILILCIVVVGLIFRVKKEGKLRDELRRNQLYLFEKGNIGDLNKECTIDEQADLLPYDKSFEVEKIRIKLGKLLGAGAFGRVMEADVDDLVKEGESTRVAVKMCKDGTDMAHLRALTLELKIMVHLGKHLNIVNLMGAYTKNMKTGDLWILVEYCKYGNLLKFIQKCRSRFINQIDPATGSIDSCRMTPLPSDSISQGPHGRTVRGLSRGTSVDADGYLETRSQADSFRGARPLARNISNASHSDSFSSTSRPGMYVGNPHYTTIGILPQESEGLGPPSPVLPGDQGVPLPSEGGNSDQQHYMTVGQLPPHLPPARHMSTTSNAESDTSYHMSPQTEITGLSSPSPFSPSSSTSGDFFFDSQGNPITFDAGGVPGISCPLTTTYLVCWAWQVANGMEYLTKRKVLHGDLAARNLLLAENNVVKISDFGLSRDIYKNDIYMKKGDEIMPIKWMAPEAIQQKVFSIQSDVWAFGITLWEMFTLGNTPYPGVPLNQDFPIALENGMRMDKPKYCNDELYDLMTACWRLNPLERPSFSRIAEHLAGMLSPEYTDNYVAMNTVYARKNEEWLEFKEDYLTMVTSPDFRNLHSPVEMDQSYIPMQGVKSHSGDIPAGGYLDMRYVKGPDSIFSPRHPVEDMQGSKAPSVFTFSGTETRLSEDLQSPMETSNLLEVAEEARDTPSTSHEIYQNNINNNNINNLNILNPNQDQKPMYQNLDKLTPAFKENEFEDKIKEDIANEDDLKRNYVNIPTVNDMNMSEIVKL